MSDRERIVGKLTAKGVKQPYVVWDEAQRADILVASALAMLEMETGIPQRNVFGCDYGATDGPPWCHQEVTPERIKALLAQARNNGVGWTQLTYRPFVLEAEALGGAHKPRFQMRVGFKVLRQNFEQYGSVREMYRAYNGIGSAAEAYASKALSLRSKWLTITEGK